MFMCGGAFVLEGAHAKFRRREVEGQFTAFRHPARSVEDTACKNPLFPKKVGRSPCSKASREIFQDLRLRSIRGSVKPQIMRLRMASVGTGQARFLGPKRCRLRAIQP